MQAATSRTQDAPIHQRRAHKRYDYSASCSIQKEDTVFEASVNNISEGGVNVRLEQLGAIQIGKSVTVKVADFDPIKAVIRWSEGSVYGLQFLSPARDHPQLSKLIEDLSNNRTQ